MSRQRKTILEIEKTAQEECGIVAIYNKKYSQNLSLALLAARGIQHRGQQGAGLASKTRRGIVQYKKDGLLQDVFTKELIEYLNKPSKWILLHCRYGTCGNYDPENLQPCIEDTLQGDKIAVIHNGEFVAVKKMLLRLDAKFASKIKEGISDTRIFTLTLASDKSENLDKKIIKCLAGAEGAYSLVIGASDSLYIARDGFGIRPLFIGEINNKGWMIASETHAFDKAEITVEREIERGEIIKIDNSGLTSLKKGKNQKQHFCDFELAYFSRPDSLFRPWLSFSGFRERCGQILAKEAPLPNASFVVGVPDSGIALATGYANKLRLPYRQTIIRDHYDSEAKQRLFMRDDKIMKIERKVFCKLSIIPEARIWQDAIVVVGDDSIVRGNVARKITKRLLNWGVREVHWIVGFPPVIYPCYLGVSIRTDGELIASRHQSSPSKIAKEIGATSVNYISPKGFIRAKLPNGKMRIPRNSKEIFLANGGCGGCLTGLYPKNKEGKNYYGN